MTRLLIFLALAAPLAGYAFWIYSRAELRVRGSVVLAVLRTATLVLLLALLLDVRVPWGGAEASSGRWVLLDASASMAADGGAAWDSASARARSLEADGWQVVPFAADLEASATTPVSPRSLLAPVLVRAAEAGVRQVRVLSDLRFQDPVASAAALAATGLDASFEAFGTPVTNAGVSSLTVTDETRRGDPVEAEVVYFAGSVSDSIQLEVREEGTLVLATALAPPTPGRRGRVTVVLPAPSGEGRLRYTARVHLAGDGFSDDDEAVAYMNAGFEAGGLVVVSLRPDWEPRALFTVLGEATGLRTTGYLRAGPDRFVPMGRAAERGEPVDSATVRAAAREAALLVIHGIDRDTDGWGRSLARRDARVLLWPLDAVGADVARAPAGAPLPGEWYASPDVPPSPVAGDLAGARLQDLPPLSSLLPLDAASAGSPVEVQLGGTGPGRPVVYLQATPGGRRAVALASGFWRWAARDGAARDSYRRLWSGVAGWLLAGDPQGPVTELRPERWVVPAGESPAWWVPGDAGDTLRLEVVDAADDVVVDTVLTPGTALTPPLAPGTYAFRGWAGDDPAGEGRFDVAATSEEMLPAAHTPDAQVASVVRPGAVGGASGGPLRRGPWPYLLLLLLLSAEWVGRRRVGLR